MRLVALAQKFDVVSESHQFLYEFLVLSGDMACQQTYVLDSMDFAWINYVYQLCLMTP